jgi:hypothetical protein
MQRTKSLWAGRITRDYKGDDPQLLALRPTKGVVILKHEQGSFSVQHRIPSVPMSDENHSFEDIESDIIQFKEAMYMNAILKGEKFAVTPFLLSDVRDEAGNKIKKGEGYEKYYDAVRNIAFLAGNTAWMTETPEKAARDIGARVAGAIMHKEIRKEAGKIYAEVQKLPAEIREAVKATEAKYTVTIEDNVYDLSKLDGKFIHVYLGEFFYGREYVSPKSYEQIILLSKDEDLSFRFS